MGVKVWSVAAADTAGLRKYYNQYKERYKWGASADVLVFNAGNKKRPTNTGFPAKQFLEKDTGWKQ